MIDVKALIASASPAEHAARADAYFAGIPDGAKLLRKPFYGIREMQATLHGAAVVLQLLQLFRDARVLDFGAGTGWFSRMLAMMDCQPVAVDVSAHALDLGRRAFERDPACAGLTVDWRPYDGVTLPLGDESVDRIVCYDAFHHVADQPGTLREFYRVLAPGGRVAFHEPGPQHSRIPVAQDEMRRHGVIENDIVVEDIWALAEAAGFTGLQLALTAPHAVCVTLGQYARVIGGAPALADAAAVVQGIADASGSLRIFAMTKGEDIRDSRSPAGLFGTVAVEVTQAEGGTLRGRAQVVNTGTAVWRPSGAETGAVSLGVKHLENLVESDHGRIRIASAPIMPGQAVELAFAIAAPSGRPATLSFDLVSEHVIWFETLGGKPAVIRLT